MDRAESTKSLNVVACRSHVKEFQPHVSTDGELKIVEDCSQILPSY